MTEYTHVITREALQDDALRRMVAAGAPDLHILSDAERAASLDATLAQRPRSCDGDGVWLFAYGSLIWNPALHFDGRRLARVYGWHRSFCLSTQAGRGTPENPGLVLGLDRGGASPSTAIASSMPAVSRGRTWCGASLPPAARWAARPTTCSARGTGCARSAS